MLYDERCSRWDITQVSLSDLHFVFREQFAVLYTCGPTKIYEEQWNEEIWKKPKLQNYIQTKENYYTEMCILNIIYSEIGTIYFNYNWCRQI